MSILKLLPGGEFHLPLIEQAVLAESFKYSGVRKLIQAVNWETDSLPELTYDDLGYKGMKFKQLQRNYYDPVEFARVAAVLAKRKDHDYTSVALSMRGAKKDSRSQGWCMLSVIITRSEGIEVVEVQYRSTEAILKFGGDLVFLPWVFEQLGVKPDKVRFRFANFYLSGVFFPTLCSFTDPVKFLDFLWKKDKKLFSGGTRFFLRSSYKKEQSFAYSPENQQHRFAWERLDMKRIRDYLHEKHKEIGKPLPEVSLYKKPR